MPPFKKLLTDICDFAVAVSRLCNVLAVSFSFGDHVDAANIGDLFDTKMMEYSPITLEIQPSKPADNAAAIGAAIAGYNKWIGEPIE